MSNQKRIGHNNLHFGPRHLLRPHMMVAVSSDAANTYTFTLSELNFSKINRGVITSDSDTATFTGYAPIKAANNCAIKITTDKAQSKLTVYDLLDAITKTSIKGLTLSALQWHEVDDDGELEIYLDGLTLNNNVFPNIGRYEPDDITPTKWIGTSWMYYTNVEQKTATTENPLGVPPTMAGFSDKTLNQYLLFDADGNQTFNKLFMSYETMEYTWTPTNS